MDRFTRSFFEAALCNSTDNSRDDGGDPLDRNYTIDDVDPTCLETLAKECERFQRENLEDIANGPKVTRDETDKRAGHDFWFTRRGHGVGFWDGDWPKDAGERLTADCELYGSVDLYLGDNGKIYAFGYENGTPSGKSHARTVHSKRLGGG